MILFTTSFSLAAPLDCQLPDSRPNDADDYLQVSLQNHQIQNLFIGGYQVIVNGKQVSDHEIGESVFNVSVTPVVVDDNETKRFKVTLQDYSDVQSWEIVVNETTKEAFVAFGFQSSDGDGLFHITEVKLICK